MPHFLFSQFQRVSLSPSWASGRAWAMTCMALMLLSACSPSFNWREVRFDADSATADSSVSTLNAFLPCKPDRATRQQDLGGVRVDLSMMGCQVEGDMGGATFTLARINLTNPASAPQVLSAWQAATLANLRTTQSQTQPISIAGASAWPPATRMTATGQSVAGQSAGGQPSSLQAVWFAKQSASGVVLFQAALYLTNNTQQPSTKPDRSNALNVAASTFFESLHLP